MNNVSIYWGSDNFSFSILVSAECTHLLLNESKGYSRQPTIIVNGAMFFLSWKIVIYIPIDHDRNYRL